ncbi:MAG: OadG family protein [Clostridia bacterium]|nr:OadG family protein [Clostridia bacterium]
MSTPVVVCMGIVTVFVCLVCLIIIISVMGKIMEGVTSKQKANTPAPAPAAAAPVQSVAPVGNKQQLVAAMAAAIAEDMGTDVGRIKILSIKKL